ncbi:UDP-2,3-diacylglucosamine diphosphatase [Pelomonas sp. SE-A7]|uniref:UDP-2,3-diacylglucosamine diphosphatase n=1 Tax=Pelomonas sp. SE-A7 TaxID=3054953 RepID=UPI00259CB12A|nr:UDP-2,3-diacylglucosamine diphosphatase [Pelomonas sp. SE-A7]MDM4765716.1 UDP-2,3-diacylglucosamine diphosphatase [Pelomonas sp. SE-A7]
MKSPEIPTPTALIAPPEWSAIDLLSDLHLSPELPHTVARLRQHLAETPASAVLLLGDIVEVWLGDDARHEGFEAEIAALLREAAAQRPLYYMIGNRDFLVGTEMLADCGMQALPDPTLLQAFGQRVLLTHGDALCLADADYQRFRAMVRNPEWQRQTLARPLAERQALARQLRGASQQKQAMQETWSDLDAEACVEWLNAADCKTLINGHTHRPMVHELGEGRQRWVLSDWDFDGEQPRGDVLRLTAAGLQRIQLAA